MKALVSARVLAVIAMAFALVVVSAGNASAEDLDFEVEATADANICSVLVTAEEEDEDAIAAISAGTLTWDGDEWTGAPFSGSFWASLSASGAPGDRYCEIDADNTDFYLNGDEEEPAILLKDALTIDGDTLPQNTPVGQVPNDGIGPFEVEWDIDTAGANPDAPEGTYISILTYTLTHESP